MRGSLWFPAAAAVKRSVDTPDPSVDSATPKIRRTAVMHNVHDVGSALHLLSLSSNSASSQPCNFDPKCHSAVRGSQLDPTEREPKLCNHADLEKSSYVQPDTLLGDDEDLFGNSRQSCDQGMLMDSAMFADRVSACSRITVADNTFLSVSKVLSSSAKSIFDDKFSVDAGCGALIVYRSEHCFVSLPFSVVEKKFVAIFRLRKTTLDPAFEDWVLM